MDKEVIERVARAMCEAEGFNPDEESAPSEADTGLDPRENWFLYRLDAAKFVASARALGLFP